MGYNEHISDADLVTKLREGDLDAFDQLFSQVFRPAVWICIELSKIQREETEELVQDVFLKIWENRKHLKKELSLKSYLFTIAYHNMCKVFRKKQLHEKFLKAQGEEQQAVMNIEKQMEYRAALEQEEQLIDQLPGKQRIIFIKSRKEGKSTKEIAAEMNLAPGTVDNQISAALKFLRKHISGNNFALLLFFAVFIQ